ncbi:unnamed protein product, partial [Sphagnum balticum]
MAGGDVLYIVGDSDINAGQGAQFMIGYGMPGTTCSTSGANNCVLGAVPSGISSSQETTIKGLVGSDGIMPQLWGTEGVNQIINLSGSGNFDVESLEITQHSSCNGVVVVATINYGIYPAGCGNGGGSVRNTYPYGPSVASSTWAYFGITFANTTNEKYPLPDPGNIKDINNIINCADQGYSSANGGYALG